MSKPVRWWLEIDEGNGELDLRAQVDDVAYYTLSLHPGQAIRRHGELPLELGLPLDLEGRLLVEGETPEPNVQYIVGEDLSKHKINGFATEAKDKRTEGELPLSPSVE